SEFFHVIHAVSGGAIFPAILVLHALAWRVVSNVFPVAPEYQRVVPFLKFHFISLEECRYTIVR
ncbi:hypothetical protein QBS64_20100, partial [Cronobacter sakazakii]|uniref:hypothetical protein n=1 Tax=Cronobacter sakazakii TaxID=28141 RepID=UPI0028114436